MGLIKPNTLTNSFKLISFNTKTHIGILGKDLPSLKPRGLELHPYIELN